MMLVAAKWHNFLEMNPHAKKQTEDEVDVDDVWERPLKPKRKRDSRVSKPERKRRQTQNQNQNQKKRVTQTPELGARTRYRTRTDKADGAEDSSRTTTFEDLFPHTDTAGPVSNSEETTTLSENRKEHSATQPAVVVPGLTAVSMWCLTCDARPQALCLMEHLLRGTQAVVREAVQALGAKQDAVALELQRAQECLLMWRALGSAAEARQDAAALRAHTAAAGRVLQAVEGMRQAVEDVCRAELPGAAEPGPQQQSNEALSVPQDSTQPKMEDLLDSEDHEMNEMVADIQLQEAPEDIPTPPLTSRPYLPDECLDVKSLCELEDYSQERVDLVEIPGLLDKVRRLDGVDCSKHPDWCKSLLERVAPRVEWLYVYDAERAHLEVIRHMPALRHLWIHLGFTEGDAPELPLQVEELTLENVLPCHFQSIHRMPFLRKLSLDWSDDPINVASPPLPPHHRGLQWLWVSLRPPSTVLSLAKAHAATLLELRVLCASEGGTPWHFRHLADGLRQCNLAALRRVVLLRGPAPDFPDDTLPHSEESCPQQKRAIKDALRAHGAGQGRRRVVVMCGECDVVPEFPELGELTWIDA
ncbi:uncharacterized protein LOC117648169 isoform X2 [Thrips palmi]|nr:uncharacterized protein LOC117648169 isoform X2 [Thrips palmi]XP_034246347.1 uncharacterized protein LOC117648169 isoform X2 [Thrips palmi]XP_034246348.1 uncharacterized protein LOC117648169 isoform X2 [Thrips palmi]XP_034246349.1 uncharacterized protein LOC117648169 isoform X2 [Thrips palmi]XP_034246350.1 uncharacterized protein LOC117648169 isoform X2 [Thrips palmi]